MEAQRGRIPSKASEGNAAENEYARASLLDENRVAELRGLDEQIGPLRERLRSGETGIGTLLEPLLDRRGVLMQEIEASKKKRTLN